jgi:ketosteroid isomerase-like protein
MGKLTMHCRVAEAVATGLLSVLCVGLPAAMAADDAAEADHDALRKLRAVVEQAINENRLELLKPHLAEGFSVVTYTDREFDDFDAFQKRWQQTREELLAGGSYTTDLQPELSQLIGDIAITKGNSKNVLVTGSGNRHEFTARWTGVCEKIDGQWKIVRVHCSLDPFGNPLVRSGARQMVIRAGLIFAVLGLACGWVARMVLVRRRREPSPSGA